MAHHTQNSTIWIASCIAGAIDPDGWANLTFDNPSVDLEKRVRLVWLYLEMNQRGLVSLIYSHLKMWILQFCILNEKGMTVVGVVSE